MTGNDLVIAYSNASICFTSNTDPSSIAFDKKQSKSHNCAHSNTTLLDSTPMSEKKFFFQLLKYSPDNDKKSEIC